MRDVSGGGGFCIAMYMARAGKQVDTVAGAGNDSRAGTGRAAARGNGLSPCRQPCGTLRPALAASIVAMSIFVMPIIASKARLAAARSGSV